MENAGHKNLRPAKPGEIRNPKGKPRGTKNTATLIKKWLKAKQEMKDPTTGHLKKLSQLDIMILQQINKARKGDTRAFEALLDRMDGRPKQINEHSGLDGEAIKTESKVESPGTVALDVTKLSTEVLKQIYSLQGPRNG